MMSSSGGTTTPHIAIIGAGAMGSVYAGMFAEAGCQTSVVDIWKTRKVASKL